MSAPETAHLVASILNAAWMVRHYQRGGRVAIQREQRQLAIRHLGSVVRQSFAQSEDFEPLLAAVVDGLRPTSEQRF